MKKIYSIAFVLLILMVATSANLFAQEEEVKVRNANNDPESTESGFKKQNLFTGGGATASFYSGGSLLGASPVLGYKLNDYFDAGVVVNYVYQGSRDRYVYNDKFRQHVFGPGVFVRAYPVPFLFAQVQLEQNFTIQRYHDAGSATANYKSNTNASSLLLGGGLSTGRAKGGTTFFYISILADVLKNRNSPYMDVDFYGTPEERIRIVPVIRAGVNVGLFQKRYGNPDY